MKRPILFLSAILILAVVLVFKNVNKKNDYSLIVLPDTQFYAEQYPEIFCSQVNWIKEQKQNLNIVFVSQLGDLVQNGGKFKKEWESISNCFKVLESINVPFAVIPGNHDYEDTDDPSSGSETYNSYFPRTRFDKLSWYKGSHNGNNNNYEIVNTVNGGKLLIINLGFEPRDESIEWADQILRKNSSIATILTTHSYLKDDTGNRTVDVQLRKDGNSGEDIWNKLITKNCNIFLVLSGHFHTQDGENKLASKNVCGKSVYQITQDYQSREKGGNGLLRIYTFTPAEKKITVQTYSTISQKYENDENSQFELDL